MRALKAVGSSFALLYLVCALFALYSVGSIEPAVAEADKPAPVVQQVFKAKAEAVEPEVSMVAEAADAVPDWMVILTSLISLAGVITAVTPTPKDNAVLAVVRKVLDIAAFNFGGAKNASADKSTRLR